MMSTDTRDPAAPGADLKAAAQRKLSFRQTATAVAWSFLGIRRGRDYQNDVNRLNPVHVIITGVIAALLFVLGLVMLVKWIVASGAAT
jgi:hypothetical protein